MNRTKSCENKDRDSKNQKKNPKQCKLTAQTKFSFTRYFHCIWSVNYVKIHFYDLFSSYWHIFISTFLANLFLDWLHRDQNKPISREVIDFRFRNSVKKNHWLFSLSIWEYPGFNQTDFLFISFLPSLLWIFIKSQNSAKSYYSEF